MTLPLTTKQQVIALGLTGQPWEEISERVGVDRKTACRWWRNLATIEQKETRHQNMQVQNCTLSPEERAGLLAMGRDGQSYPMIAKALHLRRARIARYWWGNLASAEDRAARNALVAKSNRQIHARPELVGAWPPRVDPWEGANISFHSQELALKSTGHTRMDRPDRQSLTGCSAASCVDTGGSGL